MARLTKRDITNVNMNLPTSMVNRVKEYAENMGLPITQGYVVLLNMALDYKDTINALPRVLDLVDKFDKQNNIDCNDIDNYLD